LRWLAALAAAACVAATAVLWPAPARPGAAMVAVFAPWQSREEVVTSAARDGVHILGAGRIPGSVLVLADDAGAVARLYGAGAWTVLSLDGLAGCLRAEGGSGA
jgi:hypothetical protein